MNRLGVIPVVTLIVIHDRNDVIEPTDALELTAGRQLVDVLLPEVGQNSRFFVVVGLYGTYVAVRTYFYGRAGGNPALIFFRDGFIIFIDYDEKKGKII